MGTNYYVKDSGERCSHCGHCSKEDIHIGKSSYGWAFSFQAYPELGLTSWQNYKNYLQDKVIEDEYGETMGYDKFVGMIETQKAPGWVNPLNGNRNHSQNPYDSRDWIDGDGYMFTTVKFF